MMASANVGAVVRDLKTRTAALATALVSRDGLVLYADVPAGVHTETFAIMCATVFGAAATIGSELTRESPEQIVVEGNRSTTIIVDSGRNGLLAVVVGPTAEYSNVVGEVKKFAELLKVG